MNKADRKRWLEIKKYASHFPKESDIGFLLSIIDKQDRVVEATKRHKARSVATEEALKELELEFPPPF